MSVIRRPRRKPWTARQRLRLSLLCLAVALVAFLIPAERFFRTLTGSMAVSNASDLITRSVSDIVGEKMIQLKEQGEGSFVTFEKDSDGAVTAIVTDTAKVNTLASELLAAVIDRANAGDLNIRIPLGNLMGNSFLLGKGPRIPVRITLLTSSQVFFRNVLTDAGINQTKHQLLLTVQVDADVLLPWEIRSAQIVTEVLIAETVVVGRVPDTFVNMGQWGWNGPEK